MIYRQNVLHVPTASNGCADPAARALRQLRTRALRGFARAVRSARQYDALFEATLRGQDDKPEPHVLVKMLAIGTVGLSATNVARAWWEAAWILAELRWASEENAHA